MPDDETYRQKLDRFNASENYRVDLDEAHRVMSRLRFSSMLDVGCGTGHFMRHAAAWFPRITVDGVDRQDLGAAECILADIGDPRVPLHRSYDLVTMIHSANHIARIDAAFANVSRILPEGGHLLVLNPNPPFVRIIQVLNEHHFLCTTGGDHTVVSYRSAEELTRLAAACSLELVGLEHHGCCIDVTIRGLRVSLHERVIALFVKRGSASDHPEARRAHPRDEPAREEEAR
ncbi:MAG: class I SAM-dependent methyltransferase [Polyangiaceae bacterium]|nr:class I SAM-dependent methyltransferase [Polyangiaceae bacterium]